jgi:glutaredoxin
VAKRYFAEQDIDFSECDIIADLEGRRRMALMTGQFGVPVVEVGEYAMVGWDPEEFERLRSGRFKRR